MSQALLLLGGLSTELWIVHTCSRLGHCQPAVEPHLPWVANVFTTTWMKPATTTLGDTFVSRPTNYSFACAHLDCRRTRLLTAQRTLQQNLPPVLALRRVVLPLPQPLLRLVLKLVALDLLAVVLVVHCAKGTASGSQLTHCSPLAAGVAMLHTVPALLWEDVQTAVPSHPCARAGIQEAYAEGGPG